MAKVNHRIVAVDKTRGSFTVKFWNDDIPEGFVHSVDLPVQGGEIIPLKGDALVDYLMGFCPMHEFDRVAAMKKDPTQLLYLEQLVEIEPKREAPSEPSVDDPNVVIL